MGTRADRTLFVFGVGDVSESSLQEYFDAFGSVEHNLLHYVLETYKFPPELRTYVRNLYSRLQGQIRSSDWSSSQFAFRKGVFQGDPLFPIMFLIAVNPILNHLKSLEDRYGYSLNGTRLAFHSPMTLT